MTNANWKGVAAKVTGALAGAAGTAARWLGGNWEDLLALVGLAMIFRGIAMVAPWLAWVVVGGLVFVVVTIGKIIPAITGFRAPGGGR